MDSLCTSPQNLIRQECVSNTSWYYSQTTLFLDFLDTHYFSLKCSVYVRQRTTNKDYHSRTLSNFCRIVVKEHWKLGTQFLTSGHFCWHFVHSSYASTMQMHWNCLSNTKNYCQAYLDYWANQVMLFTWMHLVVSQQPGLHEYVYRYMNSISSQ